MGSIISFHAASATVSRSVDSVSRLCVQLHTLCGNGSDVRVTSRTVVRNGNCQIHVEIMCRHYSVNYVKKIYVYT